MRPIAKKPLHPITGLDGYLDGSHLSHTFSIPRAFSVEMTSIDLSVHIRGCNKVRHAIRISSHTTFVICQAHRVAISKLAARSVSSDRGLVRLAQAPGSRAPRAAGCSVAPGSWYCPAARRAGPADQRWRAARREARPGQGR